MHRIGKLHLFLGALGALLVLATDASTVAQGSLTIGGSSANFGVHRLRGGFTPDPSEIRVVSGGSLDARGMGLGAGCVGHATATPDVILHYSNPASMLRFFVRAQGDTALLINDPNGRWACNDDASGTNPMVTFNRPAAGQYDVWVSSYQAGANIRGTLHVTELQSQRP